LTKKLQHKGTILRTSFGHSSFVFIKVAKPFVQQRKITSQVVEVWRRGGQQADRFVVEVVSTA